MEMEEVLVLRMWRIEDVSVMMRNKYQVNGQSKRR